MAHDLMGTNFYSYRQAAWHRLGTVSQKRQGAMEAMGTAGMLYNVEKYPVKVITPWGEIETGKFMLVREPWQGSPAASFGVVHERYQILQNKTIAELIAPITDEYPVETAGALGEGERIFMSLAVGTGEIGGDEIKEYFLLHEDKRGEGGLWLMYTPIRVVCKNTLTMAMGKNSNMIKLSHLGDLHSKAELEINVMAALKKARQESLEALDSLTRTPITMEEAVEAFEAAHDATQYRPKERKGFRFTNYTPDAVGSKTYMAERKRATSEDEAHAKAMEHRIRFVTDLKGLYSKFGDEFPRTGGTAWAAYNAVTEYADHRTADTGDKAGKAISALFGERSNEKQNAFMSLVGVAKKKATPKLLITV
jgi:hypothetical protein